MVDRPTQVDERTKRVAGNEALFRTVNQKLEMLNEGFSVATNTFEIVCECGDIACTEQIELPREDYERLRSEPTRFAVVRGHESAGVEDVLERNETYDVVRKREGLPTRLAEETAR